MLENVWLMTCGICHDCMIGRSNLCQQRELIGMYLQGALAEKVASDERNLLALPDDMDPVKAALTEPTATALHAIVCGRSKKVSGAKLAA